MKDVTQAGLDDLAIERILRAAGPRVPPPAEAMEEVRAAVRAEWRDVVDSRRRTRRFVSLAAAAGLAAAALTTVWITARSTPRIRCRCMRSFARPPRRGWR